MEAAAAEPVVEAAAEPVVETLRPSRWSRHAAEPVAEVAEPVADAVDETDEVKPA